MPGSGAAHGLVDDVGSDVDQFGGSDWLIARSRLNASSAVPPLRPRNNPMAWSMTGLLDSALCS